MPQQATLDKISSLVRAQNEYRKQLRIEADAWVEQQVGEKRQEIESLVMDAIRDGHRIMDIAEAYTVSGKTPNRNAIYDIKRRNARPDAAFLDAYPFEWEPRVVSTASGRRTVYDIKATLADFGPEQVTGVFRWTYFLGDVDPVITEDDPYPNTKYYRAVLDKWLSSNPYPGDDE